MVITAPRCFAPDFGSAGHVTRLALNRLARARCGSSQRHAAASRCPRVLAEIVAKTDGVPLFVEELTKTVLESGLLEETADGFALRGPLPALAIPATAGLADGASRPLAPPRKWRRRRISAASSGTACWPPSRAARAGSALPSPAWTGRS